MAIFKAKWYNTYSSKKKKNCPYSVRLQLNMCTKCGWHLTQDQNKNVGFVENSKEE